MVGFEQRVHQEFAVKRSDILDVGIHELNAQRAGHPVRPHQALALLGVSEDRLIEMLRKGVLPRPGNRGGGKVAWRADEVAAAKDRLDEDGDKWPD